MEKAPHPLDARGLPYVPLSIYEIDCGGIKCETDDVACPDTHHLLGRGKNVGDRAVKALCRLMTTELKRCQHNELHARYSPPPMPTREVAIQEIRRYE